MHLYSLCDGISYVKYEVLALRAKGILILVQNDKLYKTFKSSQKQDFGIFSRKYKNHVQYGRVNCYTIYIRLEHDIQQKATKPHAVEGILLCNLNRSFCDGQIDYIPCYSIKNLPLLRLLCPYQHYSKSALSNHEEDATLTQRVYTKNSN